MDLGGATDMLAGLRVVELSSFIAAPLAGLVMRQLGAEVIRIDPLGGGLDIGRWPLTPDRQSIYWAGLNRGKQSVSFDFTLEESRRFVQELISLPGEDCGVVISNVRGQQWLSDDELRQGRADLVHIQILGKADGSPGVDYTINAETGMPLATGPLDASGPVNHVLPAWDLLTGLYGALSVVSAVDARRRDGQGRHLTISIEDVALSTLTTLGFLAEAAGTGAARGRFGNYVYGSFGVDVQLADNTSLMIVALTPRQWSSLVDITGTRDLIANLEQELSVDFLDEGDRFRHRDVLDALIRPWFGARTYDQAADALSATAVLWAPYRDFFEVVNSLRDNPSAVVGERHDPHLGSLLSTSGPIRASRTDKPDLAPAPVLGGDTDRVLSDLLGVSRIPPDGSGPA